MTIKEFINYIEAHASKLPDGLNTELRYISTENDFARTTMEVNRINGDFDPFTRLPGKKTADQKVNWDQPAVELILAEDF